MGAALIWGGLVLAAIGVLSAGLVLFLRQRAYRHEVQYDPKQNCVAVFIGDEQQTVPVQCRRDGFVFPDLSHDAASALLELDVRASASGTLFDPAVEIRTDAFQDVQF